MKLAIVIPYYKLTFFKETLDSLANQTDKRFKLYIGDDASPENPKKLLTQYKKHFNYSYHRFETNLGRSNLIQQWERSVALSKDEEWLMVLGDDDELGSNVVEELYALLNERKNLKTDLIRFNLKTVDSLGNIIPRNFEYEKHESSQKFLKRILTPNEIISASEFVFSRQVYTNKKGFVNYPLGWFSDYATWLLFSEESGIFNITTASVFWRLSEINISSKTTDISEIDKKVSSLFIFISFLDESYKIDKSLKNEFITSHLQYLFYKTKIINIFNILIRQLFRLNLKFGTIIVTFFWNRLIKRIHNKK